MVNTHADSRCANVAKHELTPQDAWQQDLLQARMRPSAKLMSTQRAVLHQAATLPGCSKRPLLEVILTASHPQKKSSLLHPSETLRSVSAEPPPVCVETAHEQRIQEQIAMLHQEAGEDVPTFTLVVTLARSNPHLRFVC